MIAAAGEFCFFIGPMTKAAAAALLSLLLVSAQAASVVQLTKDEVEQIVAQAATEASRVNRRAVIAVVDRDGFVLAVWDVRGGAFAPPAGVVAAAVSRAGTAAFLSSDENAFTPRTAA